MKNKNKIRIFIDKVDNNFSAYSPDVLGCISVGVTKQETLNNMKEALQLHISGSLLDGMPLNEIVKWDENFEREIKSKKRDHPNYTFIPSIKLVPV